MAYYKGATEGNYLQVNAVMMNAKEKLLVDPAQAPDNSTWYLNDQPNGTGLGGGLAYKYAYSFKDVLVNPINWLYVAPGIFYDSANASGRDKIMGNKVDIGSRYGAKLDIGYDFDYGISTYITAGVAATKYNVTWVNYSDFVAGSASPATQKVSGTSMGYFYGLGVSYAPFERVSFSLEFNEQVSTMKLNQKPVIVDIFSTVWM